MFVAARDGFAACYGTSASGIHPPGSLEHADFSLTLTVHMAALVAVDADAVGRRPPSGMADLTVYLLDREHLHWHRLHGDTEHRFDPAHRDFHTSPAVMNQAVFTAALTGPLPRPTGIAVLSALDLPVPAEQVAADHSVCYPPMFPAQESVLEPLYPDRLAEDFLALTLPGHQAAYPAQPWAGDTAGTLLTRDRAGAAASWTPRALTFLATAAQCWPHLGPEHLHPLLRKDPQLAVAAGSAALTALAHLDDAEPELLSAIAAHFPERRSADLDTGMAMLTAALASHQLASTDDPVEQAAIHFGMGYRHSHAGLREQVLAAMSEAATIYRRLAAERPSALMSLDLATALTDMGALLAEQGRPEEALSATREATGIYRALTAQDPPSAPVEARRLSRQSCDAADAGGDTEEALTAAAECANIYRSLAAEDPAAFEPDLAQALAVLGRQLARAARWKQALLANTEAAQIYRRLTAEDPAAFTPDLAKALTSLGTRLSQVRRLEEAILPTREAVGIHRRLAAKNPAAFEPELALSLANLGIRLSNRAATWRMRLRHRRQARGLQEEALLATGEAVDICRRLAVADPEAFVQDLARTLWSFAWVRVASDLEVAQAVEAAHESVTLCQSLVERLPGVFTAHIRALAGLVVPSPPMATHRRRQLCGPAFVPCHWGEAGGSHFVGRPSAPTSPAAGAGSAAGTDPVGRSAAQKLQ